MRSGETLGMGLKNIDEQLHSSFLIIRPPPARISEPLGKSIIVIGYSPKNQAIIQLRAKRQAAKQTPNAYKTESAANGTRRISAGK